MVEKENPYILAQFSFENIKKEANPFGYENTKKKPS
jgi:hypothetical protein